MRKLLVRVLVAALSALSAFILLYIMPGTLSIVAFSSSLFLTLFSMILLIRKQVSERLPLNLFTIIIVIPILIAGVILIEGLFSPWSVFQVFILWSLTLTFWFNFLMLPLAIYHAGVEEKKRSKAYMYPPITVIIPAYNEEKVIASTIESVIEADYPSPKEIIVVDDGSTDLTYSIASAYSQKGVKVFRKPNGGKHSAINYGLLFAKNPIIITIDADTVVGRDALKEIVKPFRDPDVAGVAGNVLVLNKKNLLTKCQALEYVASINLHRRTMDLFGAVPVVPGVIGAFRREVLKSVGEYDPDTVTEDFDITLKCLKAGKVVQASSKALAFTEAPETFGDLYRQRLRWYRGNIQTILKHKDVFSTKRYGALRALTYPYVLLSQFVIPFLTFPVWSAFIAEILMGNWVTMAIIFLLFTSLQFLHALLAIDLSGEEQLRLAAYAPFFVVGYKHLIDFFVVKAAIDVLLFKKATWTRARRYGRVKKHTLVSK